MEDPHLALRFAVAIGLGVLLGLERERTKSEDGGAGVRTFALISLSGAIAGYLGENLGLDWLAVAMFFAITVLIVGMYVVTAQRGDTGITTEVSALLAFLLGLLCAHGQLQLASWVAVAMALLLALKDWLHQLASRINATDVEATLKFPPPASITSLPLPASTQSLPQPSVMLSLPAPAKACCARSNRSTAAWLKSTRRLACAQAVQTLLHAGTAARLRPGQTGG